MYKVTTEYAGSNLTIENESNYGIALALSHLQLAIPTEQADELMYILVEDKLTDSIYKIATIINEDEYKEGEVQIESTSYIKYMTDTVIYFRRFTDGSTRIRVIRKDGSNNYIYGLYLGYILCEGGE